MFMDIHVATNTTNMKFDLNNKNALALVGYAKLIAIVETLELMKY